MADSSFADPAKSSDGACCPCSKTAKCVRSCPCKQKGFWCRSCIPSERGKCCNRPTVVVNDSTVGPRPVLETTATASAVVDADVGDIGRPAGNILTQNSHGNVQCGSQENRFLDEKFERAFGAKLLNHSGGVEDSEARSLWWGAVALGGKQYALPNGGVGTRFVNMLSEQIELNNEGRQSSEWEFVFTALILQRNKMVRKAKDIRPVIMRRLDLWEQGRRAELLQEARRCEKGFDRTVVRMTDEHAERVFNRLMLQGKVRAAVRLITERGSGGVLDPQAPAHGKGGPLGKTVFEVLQEKHPEQQPADPSAFLECDNLPVLEEVDITAAHIETVARRLRGSAGPSGTDSDQWRSFLLRYGKASARLREAIASSTRRHANRIVAWDDMRAFLARRGIAIDKQPGVRPIGIGECRQRIEAKAMALATRLDIQDVCGADQLCAGIKAGVEAAVHAMKELFEAEETEGLLLVDAANAFNALSGTVECCGLAAPGSSSIVIVVSQPSS